LLNDNTKKELEKAAKDICLKHNLKHVYFSQRFGKRKHFLAGYGQTSFDSTFHLDIDDKFTLSWQGDMPEKQALKALSSLTSFFDQPKQEL